MSADATQAIATSAVKRSGSKHTVIEAVRFVTVRIGGMVATLLFASIVVFGSLYLAPGSPLAFLTRGRSMTPSAIAQLNARYHFDEPVPLQYLRWLGGVLHGDLGTSILYHQSVSSLLIARAPTTVGLVLFTALLVIAFGLAVGIFAGLKPGWVSTGVMTIATALMAVPAFVAAAILTLLFAVELSWFPVFGAGTGPIDSVYHLVLPSISLAIASVAFVARLTRSAIRQELTSDHVQTAISRGFSYPVVVRRHVLRNAAMPVLTVAGLTIAGLIAGSVVIEQVFQLNGLGSFLVTSVEQKDFPVVQAISLVYVAVFIVLNTIVDVGYSLLDPRVSLSGKKAS